MTSAGLTHDARTRTVRAQSAPRPSKVSVLRLCEAARTSRDLSRARRGRGGLCHHRGELHHPVSTRQCQGQGLLDLKETT